MSVVAESLPQALPQSHALTERQLMVCMAALFVVLTLAGFIPSSLAKLHAVQNGQRPPFPIALHLHAGLMGAWLLLLLAQSTFAASGRRVAHRALGMVGALMVPAIVITGAWLIEVTWRGLWSAAAAATMPATLLTETRALVSNLLLMQGRALLLFPLFVLGALWVRRRDPDAHRRLMILGTAIPVVAGLDRLAGTLGWSTEPPALDVYMLASVLPLLVWDLVRHRRLHHTSSLWLAVNLPCAVATSLLWNSPWWLAAAPRLMGV